MRERRARIDRLSLMFEVSMALTAYLKKRPPVASDRLFLSRFYTPYSVRAVQYMVGKHLERIGLHGTSVRTLRHTMATHQLSRGTPLTAV